MNNGWICLHRKLLDCSLWESGEIYDRRSAWIDLLLLANHHDKTILFDGQKMVITRGQYLTSVRQLSERWHWSKDRTLRYLRLLESLDMIHRNSNNKRTLLTIVNYRIYQDIQDTDKDTDKDTHKDTDKDTHKDTDKSQYNNTNNVNKVNNNNNNNKRFVPPSVDEVREYCRERNNNVDAEAFIDYYASQKWKKANGRPVEDWKACVRTWEKNNFNRKEPKSQGSMMDKWDKALEEAKQLIGGNE